MLKIRSEYGSKIGDLEEVLDEDEKFDNFEIEEFYTFPNIDQLSKATEKQLYDLKLGYRAKYIVDTVKTISKNGGQEWINGLRVHHKDESKDNDDEEEDKGGEDMQTNLLNVRNKLIELKGVGKKVADCIALFSMNCHNSIPVDTHVHQIATRVYGKGNYK